MKETTEKEGLKITDREGRAKTEFSDKLPKAQTNIESKEDTLRSIEDEPHPQKPDSSETQCP
jgi:hypothetical protein